MNCRANCKILPFCLLIVGSLIPAQSVAAANRLMDSVEWATIDAQMIVRAKVIAIHEEPTRENDELRWFKIELQVLETIKGPTASKLDVAEWWDPRGDSSNAM
jgi:hypothetical protein